MLSEGRLDRTWWWRGSEQEGGGQEGSPASDMGDPQDDDVTDRDRDSERLWVPIQTCWLWRPPRTSLQQAAPITCPACAHQKRAAWQVPIQGSMPDKGPSSSHHVGTEVACLLCSGDALTVAVWRAWATHHTLFGELDSNFHTVILNCPPDGWYHFILFIFFPFFVFSIL